MKIKRILTVAICLVFCIAFNNSCNHENMSRVTIYFGQNQTISCIKKESLFDRIFNNFYTSAFAKGSWNETHDSILLTISGDNMDTISASIPPYSPSYTVEVPMGDSRLFTMIAYNGTEKKWGGHVLANLNKGNESVQLNIFPIVTGFFISGSAGNCTLYWDTVSGGNISGYKIYRSTSSTGPYTYLKTVTTQPTGDNGSGTFYYRISVVYPQGEGEMCDYQSVTM